MAGGQREGRRAGVDHLTLALRGPINGCSVCTEIEGF